MAKPNIVVIHVDALRSDYSIHLSRMLGSDWIIYPETYTPLYGTDPVLTTMFTGMYPARHGIIRHGPWVTRSEMIVFRLRARGMWVPEILASAGYMTIAYDILGRWHRRGFKQYNDLTLYQRSPLDRAKRIALKISRRLAHALFANPPTQYPPAPALLNHVLSDVKSVHKPFMALIHIWDTHTPYLVSLCKPRRKAGEPLSKLLARIRDPRWRSYLRDLVAWRADTIEDIVERYRAAACSVGKALRIFIDSLKDAGLYDDTVIVLYSDHGESLGEHGAFFDHHTLHEEVVKSFLAVKPAGRAEPIRATRVSLVDVAPTLTGILHASGAVDDSIYRRLAARWDGLDLTRESPPGSGKERPYYFGMVADKPGLDVLFGVTVGDWKYVESFMPNRPSVCPRCGAIHHDRVELFNLARDPAEKENLAATETDKAAELRNLLLKHLSRARHPELKRLLGEASAEA